MHTLTHHYHRLRSKSLGLLALRIPLAAIFIYAGAFKLANMASVVPAFQMMGIGPVLSWAVAIIELLGGISILVGWWSKFFSGALIVIMIVAMAITKAAMIGDPVGNLHWLLIGSLLAIFLAGCGRFSLCAWKHHRDCANCKTDGKCGCEHTHA